GTIVRVDPVRHIASEGSVSVIDLSEANPLTPALSPSTLRSAATEDGADGARETAKPAKARVEIVTGMHASALAVTPNSRYVVVANTGSDTLSVIDTRTDKLVETIWARQDPGDLFGAQPNALVFDKGGKRLFICNGTQNAVAVVEFDPGK